MSCTVKQVSRLTAEAQWKRFITSCNVVKIGDMHKSSLCWQTPMWLYTAKISMSQF